MRLRDCNPVCTDSAGFEGDGNFGRFGKRPIGNGKGSKARRLNFLHAGRLSMAFAMRRLFVKP